MKRVWIAVLVALVTVMGLVAVVAGQEGGALGFQPFTVNVVHEEPVTVVSTATTAAGEVVTVTTPITIGVNLQIDVTGPSVAQVSSDGATASGVELVVAAPAPAPAGVDGFVDTGGRVYTVDVPDTIELGQVQTKGNTLGMVEVFGTLTNVGESALKFVEVSGQFYDEAGVLLGVGSGYADLDELEAGQSSQFQMILVDLDFDDLAGYSIQVQD